MAFPKPPDLDAQGNPISGTDKPPDLDATGKPVSEGIDYGKSFMKGVMEGIPEIDLIKPLEGPAQDQGIKGALARGAMYPAGAISELWNRGVKPLTSIPNMGLLALSAAVPESIPITSAVFGAQMGSEIPNQVRDVYQGYQKEGLSPNTWRNIGDLGMTAGMTIGAVHGANRYLAEKNPIPVRREVRDVVAESTPPEIPPEVNAILNGVNKGTAEEVTAGINRALLAEKMRREDAAKTAEFMNGKPVAEDPNRLVGPYLEDEVPIESKDKIPPIDEGPPSRNLTHDQMIREKAELDAGEIPVFGTPDDPYWERGGKPPINKTKETPQPVFEMTGDPELDALTGRLERLQVKARATGLSPIEQRQMDGLFQEIQNHVPITSETSRLPDETFQKPEGYDSNRVLAIWRNKMKANEKSTLPPHHSIMSDEAVLHWQRQEAAKDWAATKAARPAPVTKPEQPQSGLTYVIRRDTASREFIEKAQDQGYQFLGLTDKGDYRFRKPGESKSVPTGGDENISSIDTAPSQIKRLITEEKGSLNLGDIIKGVGGVKVGTNVVIKRGAAPTEIRDITSQGYRFIGEDAQGNLIFKRTSKPGNAPILETEVGQQRATAGVAKAQLGPLVDVKKASKFTEAYNLPRGLMAAMDFSAPLRQGLGLIHKKEFWTALPDMFKAWRTEEGFRAVQTEIANKPLFKARVGPDGKMLPSFADDAGLQLTDLTNLSKREEAIMSTWAEKVPGVRASNRAYTAFLNKLRASAFETMVKDMKVFGLDAKVNVPLAREVASFINHATGRGSLGSLERSAVTLNTFLFSPRLIASRLGMMKGGVQALFSPEVYMMRQPSVRREYLKSLLAIAAVGNTVTQLGRMAGGTVSSNPTDSDFGKLKVGNVRLDPFGGYQQYIVAASRLLSSTTTSSSTGKEYDMLNPKGPYAPTHAGVIGRFARGKAHPVVGFAYSLLANRTEMSGEKMNFTTPNPMENSIAQRFIPIVFQDLYEISKSEPELLPIFGPLSVFGMSVQSYGDTSQNRGLR